MIVDELRHAVAFLEQKPPGSQLPTPAMPIHKLLRASADEIERLRLRNAALVEVVREGKCPADDRCTVAECQQCGCSLGILTAVNEQETK